MIVLRFVAGLCLIAALIAFVTDYSRPRGPSGTFRPTSLERMWLEAAPKSLIAVRQTVSQTVSPLVWTSVFGSVLQLPTFLAFGAAGGLLGYLGRRRSRVNIYVN